MKTDDLDVVYVVGPDRPGDALRYSLRSLKNLPHRDVWTIGTIPEYVGGDAHLRALEPKEDKWENINQSILTAACIPDITENFILMNDDFFVYKPCDDLKMYHQGPLPQYIDRLYESGKNPDNGWFKALRRTRDFGWRTGTVDTRAFECHTPLVFNKECVQDFFDDWAPMDLAYGAYFDEVSLEDVLPSAALGHDVKVFGAERKHCLEVRWSSDQPFLSTSERSWTGFTGAFIRQLFPEKSRYERDYH